MKDKIEWNDAIGDLQLLAGIERNAIEAYIQNDVIYYYKWIRAYFQKLCTIVYFDREKYQTKFKEIQQLIWGGDLNKDGHIDEEELINNSVNMAKALEDLEEIYYELADLKVQANLSVGKKDILDVKKRKDFEKNYPVLDVKQ